MNLSDLQSLLARLVTEPDLRERFLNDPAKAADTQGWDSRLARALSTIPASRLRHYGDSLVNKRCHEAARCLPLTQRALGFSRFRELFRVYAAGTMPEGPTRRRDDVIAFAGALRHGRCALPEALAWVSELAAYEAAWLRCANQGDA